MASNLGRFGSNGRVALPRKAPAPMAPAGWHPNNTRGLGAFGRTDVVVTPPKPPVTTAPPGTYDTALDAQLQNANLGYEWAAQDYKLGNQRRQTDLQTGLAGILRNYTNLANSQAERAAQMGVDQGGALAQALAKRTANQGLETTAAQQAFDRSQQNADTSFQRAGVTNTMFGQQINDQMVQQARLAGLLPAQPSPYPTYAVGAPKKVPVAAKPRMTAFGRPMFR